MSCWRNWSTNWARRNVSVPLLFGEWPSVLINDRRHGLARWGGNKSRESHAEVRLLCRFITLQAVKRIEPLGQ